MPTPAAPDLASIVASATTQKNMRSRSDLTERGWAFWELRNLNMHRVVGLLRAERRFADTRTLDAELRGTLARNFKRAWWRGIAYGVVAQVETPAFSSDDLEILVDGR